MMQLLAARPLVGLTVYSLDRKAVEGRCLLGARILLEMRRRTRSAKIRNDRDLSTPDIQYVIERAD